MTEPGSFAGKTVVVTGAAGGLGRSFALGFAGRGADLVIADVNTAGAEETVAMVERLGARAIAVATDEGVSDRAIVDGLAGFQGVGRRFQVQGNFRWGAGEIMLVDDYGHHPREVAAVIKAVRAGWPERRLVMLYQPHRYSRTRDLYEDFVQVLGDANALLLMEVYPAGEEPVTGADSKHLCRSIRQRGQLDPIYVERDADVMPLLEAVLQPGDILLTQGAGDIGGLSVQLADALATHSREGKA